MIHIIVKDLSEVTYAVKEVIKRAKEVLGLDDQIKVVDIDEAIEHDIEGIGLGVDGYGVRTLSPKQLVSRGTSLTFLVQAITRYIDPKSYEELVEGKNYVVCGLNTLEDLIDMYKQEKEPRTIALDIETAGNVDRDPFASGEILSIAIYDATEDKAFVLPEALAEDGYVYDLLQALQGHQIVCHNGTFDMPFLSHHAGARFYHQDDTLLMHYVLFNTAQEHGLKPLAQRWLNAPDWDSANDKYLKGGAHYEYIPRKQLYLYNAYDAVWTYRLYKLFHAMLEEQPEMRAYYEYRMRVSKMLQDVQLNGVPVDVDVLDELEEQYSAVEEETLTFLRSQAGQTFNPRSTKQLKEFFAAKGVHEKSFKEDVLKKLRRDRPDLAEFIDTLLQYRSATKVLSSYISTVRGFVGNDGRVHPTYLPHGAKTGRLSAKSPAIQTMGRDSGIKKALYAPEGYKIISCDYSQAELRTVAELSDDANMMSAFQPGAPDFFDDLMTKVYPEEFPTIADYEAFDRENHLEAENKRALIKSIVYGCVPLHQKILTKRGWLTYNEVLIGDETWGIDPNTGLAGWTVVEDVFFYSGATTHRYSTRGFSIRTTPSHRWYGQKRKKSSHKGYEEQWLTSESIKHDDRLIVSAAPKIGDMDDWSYNDVCLLAWVLSDGCISWSKSGKLASMSIVQSKPQYVEEIDELMKGYKHGRHARKDVNYSEIVSWRLANREAYALLERANFGKNFEGLVEWVSSLSSSNRDAFLATFCKAEGYIHHDGTWVITQNPGPKSEAVKVAAHSLGFRVTTSGMKIRLGRNPVVTGQRMVVSDQQIEDVWCVQTSFGTWTTMDDNGNPVITGNSNYGRGTKAIAIALEKPVEDAKHVLDMYYSAYPNLKKWQDSIRESVGNDSLSWRTITPFGLRFKQEVVTYKNQNKVGNEALAFVPQSTANDICLHAAIEINKRVGQYGAQLIGLVHDATYVLCPEDKVEECSKMMENEMRGAARLVFHRVPFEAEAEVGDSWAEV